MANTAGIKVLERPETVDMIDWAFEHIGCNALIKKGSNAITMSIIAYATDKIFNHDLIDIQKKTPNSIIFKNVNENEVDSID